MMNVILCILLVIIGFNLFILLFDYVLGTTEATEVLGLDAYYFIKDNINPLNVFPDSILYFIMAAGFISSFLFVLLIVFLILKKLIIPKSPDTTNKINHKPIYYIIGIGLVFVSLLFGLFFYSLLMISGMGE